MAEPPIQSEAGDENLSVAVQESDNNEPQNRKDILVSSKDRGNVAAGQLVQKLINQVETLTRQLCDSTKDINSTIESLKIEMKRLDQKSDDILCVVNEEGIKEAIVKCQKALDQFKCDYKIEKENFSERIDILEKDVKDLGDTEKVELMEKVNSLSGENQELLRRVKCLEECILPHKPIIMNIDQNEDLDTADIDKPLIMNIDQNEDPNTAITDNPIAMSFDPNKDLNTAITALISKLDNFADQLAPKETMERRKSMSQKPPQLFEGDNYDTSTPYKRTYSSSSSGRGTLAHGDSKDNGIPSISEDSGVHIETSTPAAATNYSKTRSLSVEERNSLHVVWAMTDFLYILQGKVTNWPSHTHGED